MITEDKMNADGGTRKVEEKLKDVEQLPTSESGTGFKKTTVPIEGDMSQESFEDKVASASVGNPIEFDPIDYRKIGSGKFDSIRKELDDLKMEAKKFNASTDKAEIDALESKKQYLLSSLNKAKLQQEAENGLSDMMKLRLMKMKEKFADGEQNITPTDLYEMSTMTSYLNAVNNATHLEMRQKEGKDFENALAKLMEMRNNEGSNEPVLLQEPKDILKKQAYATAITQGATLLAGVFGGDIGLGARAAVQAGAAGTEEILKREAIIDAGNMKLRDMYNKTLASRQNSRDKDIAGIIKQHMDNLNELDKKRMDGSIKSWESEKKAAHDNIIAELNSEKNMIYQQVQEGKLGKDAADFALRKIQRQESIVRNKYSVDVAENKNYFMKDKANMDATIRANKANNMMMQKANKDLVKLGSKTYKWAQNRFPLTGAKTIIDTLNFSANPGMSREFNDSLRYATIQTKGISSTLEDLGFSEVVLSQDVGKLNEAQQFRNTLENIYEAADLNGTVINFLGGDIRPFVASVGTLIRNGVPSEEAVVQVAGADNTFKVYKEQNPGRLLLFKKKILDLTEDLSDKIGRADVRRNVRYQTDFGNVDVNFLLEAAKIQNTKERADYVRSQMKNAGRKGKYSDDQINDLILQAVDQESKLGR